MHYLERWEIISIVFIWLAETQPHYLIVNQFFLHGSRNKSNEYFVQNISMIYLVFLSFSIHPTCNVF